MKKHTNLSVQLLLRCSLLKNGLIPGDNGLEVKGRLVFKKKNNLKKITGFSETKRIENLILTISTTSFFIVSNNHYY